MQTWRSSLAPSRVYTREHSHPECEGSEEEEGGGLPLSPPHQRRWSLRVQGAKGARVDCTSSVWCQALCEDSFRSGLPILTWL